MNSPAVNPQPILRDMETKHLRVLLVDDYEPFLLLLRNLLGSNSPSFIVDTATTAASARRMIQADHYDLVMLDEILPDMRGCKLIEELQREGVVLPWILLSGIVDDRLQLECQARRLQANAVLWKNDKHGLKNIATIIQMAVFNFRLGHGSISTLHTLCPNLTMPVTTP